MPTVYKVNYGPQSLSVLADLIHDFKDESPFASVTVVVDSKPKALYLRHNLLNHIGVDSNSGHKGLLNVDFKDFESFYGQLKPLKNKIASGLLLDAAIWNCLNSEPNSYFYGFREHLPTRNKLASILIDLDSSMDFSEFLTQEFSGSSGNIYDSKTDGLISLYQKVVLLLEGLGYTLSYYSSSVDDDIGSDLIEKNATLIPVIFYLPELLGVHTIKTLIDLLPKLHEGLKSNLKFIVGSSPIGEIEKYIVSKIVDPICKLFKDGDSTCLDIKAVETMDSDLPDFKFIITPDITTEIAALNHEMCSDLISGYAPSDLAVLAQDEIYGRAVVQLMNRSQIECNGYLRTDMSDSYVGLVLGRFVNYLESDCKDFELWDLLSILQNSVFDKIVNRQSEELLALKSNLSKFASSGFESLVHINKGLDEFYQKALEVEAFKDWNQVVRWLQSYRDLFFDDYLDLELFSTRQQLNALHDFNNFLEDVGKVKPDLFEVSKFHVLQVLKNFLSQKWSIIPVTGNGLRINYLNGSAGVSADLLYVMDLVEGNIPATNSDDLMLPTVLSRLLVEDSRDNALAQQLLLDSSVRSCKKVRFFCSLNKLTSGKRNVISRFMLSYLSEMKNSQGESIYDNNILTNDLYKFENEPYLNKYTSYFNLLTNADDNWLNEGDALKSLYANNPGLHSNTPYIEFVKHSNFRVDTSNSETESTQLSENNLALHKLNMSDCLGTPIASTTIKLSFSRLKNYLSCPKKYFYSNVLNLEVPHLSFSSLSPLDTGFVLAKALEYFNSKLALYLDKGAGWFSDSKKSERLLQKTIDEYFKYFDLEKLNKYEKVILEEQAKTLKHFLVGELDGLMDSLERGLSSIQSEFAVFTDFKFIGGSVVVDGRIDRFDIFKSGQKIIRDYKATVKKSSVNNYYASPSKKLSISTYFHHPEILQNLFYAWILNQSQNIDIDKTIYSYEFPFMSSVKPIEGKIDESIINDVTYLVTTAALGILANQFPAYPDIDSNGVKCKFCLYRSICKDRHESNWSQVYFSSHIGELNEKSRNDK